MTEFRFDERALARLIERYETLRDRNGMGSLLRRVTPAQWIDALHVCMAAYASGRVPDGDQRAFWFAHLKPVLSETREAAAVLKEAFEDLFGATTGNDKVERPSVVTSLFKPVANADAEPRQRHGLRKTWQRWKPTGYVVAIGMAIVTAAIIALLIWKQASDPPPTPPDPPDRDDSVRVLPLPLPRDPRLSLVQQEYRTFLRHTQQAIARYDNEITPHALATALSGAAPQIGEPSLVLAEMMRQFPSDPAASIPRSEFGTVALRHYAAVAAALSLGTSVAAIDQSNPVDQAFGDFISSPRRDISTRFSRDTWPVAIRYLPFLFVIPSFVWAFWGSGNRRREVVASALVEARTSHATFRRAEGGQWGTRLLIQSSTGLPPLPSASQTARYLLRLREVVPNSRLDIDKSVRASLASAGDVVTVMRDGSKALDIVFLVRRRHRHDHERARLLRLLDALSRSGVSLTAYDFAPDPRTLTATSRTDAIGKRDQQRTLNLRGLRELHADALLVIVTDGDDLIDRFSQKPHAFVKDELRLWPRRMLLTPTPVAEWGEREMNLAAALDGPVGRASMAGLGVLALGLAPDSDQGLPRRILNRALLRSGFFERIDTWSAAASALAPRETIAPRPALLNGDEISMLQELAPPQDEQNRLLMELRSWLGTGFLWFAACGVYPQLRVDLTLWLGGRLRRFGYPENPAIFSEDLFDRLCLLPWFRAGHMPDWLRNAAFARLSEREKQHVRQVIDELASGEGNQRIEGALGLQVWQADWRGQPVGADDVMLEFKDEAGPLRPPTDESKVKKNALQRWVMRGYMRVGIVAAWAAVAAWLAPAFEAAPHAPGAWWPLIAFVGVSVLLLLAALAYRGFRVLRAGQEDKLVEVGGAHD